MRSESSGAAETATGAVTRQAAWRLEHYSLHTGPTRGRDLSRQAQDTVMLGGETSWKPATCKTWTEMAVFSSGQKDETWCCTQIPQT
jgi:hypothetical protein